MSYNTQATRNAAAYWYAQGALDTIEHRGASAAEFVRWVRERDPISGGRRSPEVARTIADCWISYLKGIKA